MTRIMLKSFYSLFFDYERGQKVGLWILAINSGLLVGPISKSSSSTDSANTSADSAKLAVLWTWSINSGLTG